MWCLKELMPAFSFQHVSHLLFQFHVVHFCNASLFFVYLPTLSSSSHCIFSICSIVLRILGIFYSITFNFCLLQGNMLSTHVSLLNLPARFNLHLQVSMNMNNLFFKGICSDVTNCISLNLRWMLLFHVMPQGTDTFILLSACLTCLYSISYNKCIYISWFFLNNETHAHTHTHTHKNTHTLSFHFVL